MVKIRLSGGILGAVEREEEEKELVSSQTNKQIIKHAQQLTFNQLLYYTLKILVVKETLEMCVNLCECSHRPHLRNQSALSLPAGGSRTAPQPAQHPGLSSGRESYGKGSTADPLHAPFHHYNTHKNTNILILFKKKKVF